MVLGKTTCLRILCTLLAADAGSVQIAGIDAIADPRGAREQLGYVAQEVAIDKILSGRELLQLQASLYHLDSATSRRRIDELTGAPRHGGVARSPLRHLFRWHAPALGFS